MTLNDNRNKLVRWDADYYKSLTDDDCLVCLTERQVYLIMNMLEQIKWYTTRWIGDKSGLDFDDISTNLAYRIMERMTCTNVADILSKIEQLEVMISKIYNETLEDEGETPFSPSETTIDEVGQDMPQVSVETCDDDGKDAIYGMVNQLVRYMLQKNLDFLEQLSQVGNISDQIDRVFSSIPVIETIPVDEVVSWVTFVVDELLEEYNATITEEVINAIVCDIFCLAVSRDCVLDFRDVYDYFAGKVSPTFSTATSVLLDLVQFAITGTFSGTDYIYYLTYFQLFTVGLAQLWAGIDTLRSYEIQMLIGLDEPSDDWELLCDECPEVFRQWIWDFQNGLGEWTFDILSSVTLGTLDAGRAKGVAFGDQRIVAIELPFDPTWRIRSAKIYTHRVNGIGNGTDDTSFFRMRPTSETDVGSFTIISGGFRPNGDDIRCSVNNVAPMYWTGANQIIIAATVTNNPTSEIYIDKVEILFTSGHNKANSVVTEDNDLCT